MALLSLRRSGRHDPAPWCRIQAVVVVAAVSQRVFGCEHCGFVADRDWNAAKNLERLAANSTVSAGREDRSGAARKNRVKRASRKQEPNGIAELCAA